RVLHELLERVRAIGPAAAPSPFLCPCPLPASARAVHPAVVAEAAVPSESAAAVVVHPAVVAEAVVPSESAAAVVAHPAVVLQAAPGAAVLARPDRPAAAVRWARLAVHPCVP